MWTLATRAVPAPRMFPDDDSADDEFCCNYESRIPLTERPKKRAGGFILISEGNNFGQSVHVTLDKGKLVKTYGGAPSQTLLAFSKRHEDRSEARRVYQDSYPDVGAPPGKGKAPKTSGKRKASEKEVPQRPPGVYRDVGTDTCYVLTEDCRRKTVNGTRFYHPILRRVVLVSEGGRFTEIDSTCEISQGIVGDSGTITVECPAPPRSDGEDEEHDED